ncbi:laccase domain-containing protein [Candidatus Woesebacteria bacterium]|nr:MAG: laccase domain-containing protein [Candidatus Woesebacteria bacterium]
MEKQLSPEKAEKFCIIYAMYQIEKLTKFSNLFHAISTTREGNMSYNFGDLKKVNENMQKFLVTCKVDGNRCSTIRLVHGTRIVEVKKPANIYDPDSLVDADAMITRVRRLFLLIKTADCLPIMLFDPKVQAVGLVHAGWKGTENEITVKTVLDMKKYYGTKPSHLVVGIGPGIRKASYEFDKDTEKFSTNSRVWEKYISRKGDNYLVDLFKYNIDQLVHTGVKENNIIDCKIDTAKDKRFFSHYRDVRTSDGDRGRFVTVVGLK